MCADHKGIVVKRIGRHVRHVGPEAHVFEAARALEKSEAVDPEAGKQVRADEAALEAWLRNRGGQPWFDGIVMECVDRFPGLDRFQVSAVIYELRDEAGALMWKEMAEESVRKFGFDIHNLSERELDTIREAGVGPEAVAVWERLKRRHGNQQNEKEETQEARTDAETGQAG